MVVVCQFPTATGDFTFETDEEGWTATTTVGSAVASQADGALSVDFVGAAVDVGDGGAGGVPVVTPTDGDVQIVLDSLVLLPGQTVTLSILVPADAGITDITGFVQRGGGNQTEDIPLSVEPTADQWTTVDLVIPDTIPPNINALGIRISTNSAESFTVDLDDVVWECI